MAQSADNTQTVFSWGFSPQEHDFFWLFPIFGRLGYGNRGRICSVSSMKLSWLSGAASR